MSARHARRFRPRRSERVWFPQVKAQQQSEVVALGLPKSRVIVTSGVTNFRLRTDEGPVWPTAWRGLRWLGGHLVAGCADRRVAVRASGASVYLCLFLPRRGGICTRW